MPRPAPSAAVSSDSERGGGGNSSGCGTGGGLSDARQALLVWHLFSAFTLCAVDRACLSVLILPIAEERGWSSAAQGGVMSALFAGYLTTGVVAGRAADTRGGRGVMAGGVALWSAATAMTPPAARAGVAYAVACRFVLGCGEGCAMPAMNAMVQVAVAERRVSRALACIYSGMFAGSVLGLGLSPPLMRAGGDWAVPFYVFGACGFAWMCAFLCSVRAADVAPCAAGGGEPVRHGRGKYTLAPQDCSSSEDSAAAGDVGNVVGERLDERDEEVPSFRRMLSEKAVLAIFVAHFCATNGFFTMVVWLPSFLVLRFGASVASSARLSTAPYLVMFAVSNAAGAAADGLLARGWDRTLVRKGMQTVGFVGPAACLAALAGAATARGAAAWATAGLGLHAVSQAGVYCSHQDISSGRRVAGVLLGLSNSFASLPGIGVGLVGLILDRSGGNWNLVFTSTIAVYAVGTIVFLAYGTGENVF